MKILYIVTAFPRSPDDVITPWMVETIHRLRERSINADVLAPSYRGLGNQNVDGVQVHRFRYAPAPWETLTHDQTAPDRIREHPLFLGLLPGYLLAGAVAARRLARAGGFDLVHAFWPLPHGFMGHAAKVSAGIPLVSTFFGVELMWVQHQLPFLQPAVRWIAHVSDAVTVISSYTAAELHRLAPSVQPTVIPFGAAVRPAQSLSVTTHVPAVPYELLFVGRLVARKGVAVLLRSVAKLPCSQPVVLHIAGDGPDRPMLEALASELAISDQVRFHGFVSPTDLSQRFVSCDAFILPATVDSKGDTEGLGVVLLEALSYGKPVIASATGGITDIVRHHETGLLVPPGDVEALAAAITEYMTSPARAQAMGEAGRRHVEANFSWSAILDRLEHVYRSVT